LLQLESKILMGQEEKFTPSLGFTNSSPAVTGRRKQTFPLEASGKTRNLASHEPLPLICPCCLNTYGHEARLDGAGACASCGAKYPTVEGIPVLIADEHTRHALGGGHDSLDARARFYQENAEYLREQVEGSEKLSYALNETDKASGLVLEIGSGQGAFAGFGGANYCALDFSLNHLKTYLCGSRRICASAETIPLASKSCRLVFSFATFEHVPRPDLAFAEVDRVLAPGGVACLAPAWHCRDWAAEGLAVRPYHDLNFGQRIRKALIPLRDSVVYRGVQQIPWRMWRRGTVRLIGMPSSLHYRPLKANYEHFWQSDSDACSCIDSHEGVLFFASRKYDILEPPGRTLAQFLFRAGPIIVRKPFMSINARA
jgi:SAM-dependent methyltransferase